MLQGGVLDLAWVGVALPCQHLPSVAEVLLAVVGLPLGAVVAPLGVVAGGLLVAGVAAVAVHLVVDVDLVNICLLFPIQSAYVRT
jgi:hypothetical protein